MCVYFYAPYVHTYNRIKIDCRKRERGREREGRRKKGGGREKERSKCAFGTAEQKELRVPLRLGKRRASDRKR